MKLEHGINRIWDMEIGEYNGTYLSEMDEDTVIEVLKQFGSEDLYPFISIKKVAQNKWIGTTSVAVIELAKDIIEKELEKIKEIYDEYTDLIVKDEIEISVILNSDVDIPQAVDSIKIYADMIVDDLYELKNHRVSRLAYSYIALMLPVYHRAMEKVKLELTNYITDAEKNEKKIVDICGRVKTKDSICEKIKRKAIGQYEVFEKFDDIAGVRCTCEYLDDVYDVLEYIKKNPMFDVIEIDDKIKNPTQEGYRGVHVIVSTKIYYQEKVYDSVKVEIQLRTAFQNAWSMKTHQLTYKKDSIDSKEIKSVLRKLSDVLREADETALQMKKISNKK